MYAVWFTISFITLINISDSVVTVLLFLSRFGFGSVFPEKPRFRFFSISVLMVS